MVINDDSFPVLKNAITDDLMQKVLMILAPDGFHDKKPYGPIVTRQVLPKKDIEQTMQIVYDFCHNDRVKLLKEIENIHSHFCAERSMLDGHIAFEQSKNFFRRDTAALRVWNRAHEVTSAKIKMLEFLFNILNR